MNIPILERMVIIFDVTVKRLRHLRRIHAIDNITEHTISTIHLEFDRNNLLVLRKHFEARNTINERKENV